MNWLNCYTKKILIATKDARISGADVEENAIMIMAGILSGLGLIQRFNLINNQWTGHITITRGYALFLYNIKSK